MTNESEKPSGAKPDDTQPSPVQTPTPTPTPFPVAGPGVSKQVIREVRTKGQRYLFINVLLMFLVSIVVFTIGAFFFLVPRIVTQDIEIRQLESKLADVRVSLENTKSILAKLETAAAPAETARPDPAPPSEPAEAIDASGEEEAAEEKHSEKTP